MQCFDGTVGLEASGLERRARLSCSGGGGQLSELPFFPIENCKGRQNEEKPQWTSEVDVRESLIRTVELVLDCGPLELPHFSSTSQHASQPAKSALPDLTCLSFPVVIPISQVTSFSFLCLQCQLFGLAACR